MPPLPDWAAASFLPSLQSIFLSPHVPVWLWTSQRSVHLYAHIDRLMGGSKSIFMAGSTLLWPKILVFDNSDPLVAMQEWDQFCSHMAYSVQNTISEKGHGKQKAQLIGRKLFCCLRSCWRWRGCQMEDVPLWSQDHTEPLLFSWLCLCSSPAWLWWDQAMSCIFQEVNFLMQYDWRPIHLSWARVKDRSMLWDAPTYVMVSSLSLN